ncbi:OprO/OprP family phosphate-selective porin [Zavarzinella formosa]|uniref:OprO/OprP family phosphate-selective porin n=1 Tax=Zavarzinella formosa TaxID=360055 RepID=UPI0002D5CE07|nr:porin [Zavarzinella formosa]
MCSSLSSIVCCFSLALALFFGRFACPEALAQEGTPLGKPLETRIQELEETVRRLEQAKSALADDKPVDPSVLSAINLPEEPKAKTPILAGWDNGFILRSPNDDFKLRITGQIQSDYRDYLDHNDTTDVPSFLVRRARLGIEATVLKYYEFRLLPDFGQGTPRIVDSYFNIHYWDALQFEVGKFKQAFSFEQLIQDRFVPTVERSLIDQLGPQRDVGLMVHGQKLFDDRLDYGVTVYNGVQNGDQDSDRNKEMSARVAIRPFKQSESEGLLDGLQLGLGGTWGNDTSPLAPTIYRTPANVAWFRYATGARPDGVRWRLSPELVYLNGPFSLTSQYYHESRDMRPAADKKGIEPLSEVKANGFFVMTTLLVTGENRTSMSQNIDPLRPFNPRDGLLGPGAWELVGRVSHLEFGDDDNPAAFTRLINRATTSRAATEMTSGFNWYLNKFVRVQFNWEYARFGDAIRLGGAGPGGLRDHQNSFVTRLQIVF